MSDSEAQQDVVSGAVGNAMQHSKLAGLPLSSGKRSTWADFKAPPACSGCAGLRVQSSCASCGRAYCTSCLPRQKSECACCGKLCSGCRTLHCSFCDGATAASMCEQCASACDGCKQFACQACAAAWPVCPRGCGWRACEACRMQRGGVQCKCSGARAAYACGPSASTRAQLAQLVHPLLVASSMDACCGTDTCASTISTNEHYDEGVEEYDTADQGDEGCYGSYGGLGSIGYSSFASGMAAGPSSGGSGAVLAGAAVWGARARSYSQRRVMVL